MICRRINSYDVIAISGAIAAGICVILIRHLRHTETTSNIFAAQCVFTFAIGLAGTGHSVFIADLMALFWVIITAITVVAAQLCLTEAFRYMNVAKGSSLQMLTPIVTAAGSVFFFGEPFTLLEVAGGAAIIFASYKIINTAEKRESTSPIEPPR